MRPVLYPFACDENGHVVSIDSVSLNDRVNHRYFCPGCGKEMRPRLGSVYQHCFYHVNNVVCDVESYIHQCAKAILYHRFKYSSSPFILVVRDNDDEFRFDLRKYFDTATVEGEYRSFVADIKLCSYSQPELPPLFIEVFHTHGCSPEKINSGIRIMELRVLTLTDLRVLFYADFLSGNNQSTDLLYPVTLYNINSGFRRSSFSPGFFLPDYDDSCILFPEWHDDSSWFDVTFDRNKLPEGFSGYSLVTLRNRAFSDCRKCRSCKIDKFPNGKIFNISCNKACNGSLRDRAFDERVAVKCSYFCPMGFEDWPYIVDKVVDYSSYKEGIDYFIWRNPLFEPPF